MNFNTGPSRPLSPFPKRLHAPLPPSPHRTTSQLSTVSVEAHHTDDVGRQLLSQTRAKSTRRSDDEGDLQMEGGMGTTSTTSVMGTPRMTATPRTPRSPGGATPTPSSDTSSLPEPRGSGSSTPAVSLIRGMETTAMGSSPGGGSILSERVISSRSRKGKEKAVVDVEVEQVDVQGELTTAQMGDESVATPGLNGRAAKGLRELVRRSTVGEEGRLGLGMISTEGRLSRATSTKGEIHALEPPSQRQYSPRQYYVLTHAGKPVFCSHEESSEENLTNLMGVVQALISIFAEDDDRPRCIVRGEHRIAFVLKAPIYLFCVSDWGEPENVLRVHLDYIHLQILSVISSTTLSRVFQRRSNFDLTRLLEGTGNFLHALIRRCQYDFSYLTSTLQPLRMAPALRDTAAAALMPPAKFKDLLYVILIAGGHIVTLLRPRKHSIHPSDLHLLLNTLLTSTTLRSSETWVPMCFPKFNPAGFVHAYVSYVLEDVGLVFVSADREAFEELRGWKGTVLEKLDKDKTLLKIQQSIPHHPYSISTLSIPGLRHFIYKSRQNVQITAPEWEAPYDQDNADRKKLITLYQQLHDTVHARSGQASPLRLVYIRTENEACLAWVTKPFELYMTTSPHLSKSAVVAAANAVARWVTAEEGRLFLKDAPVF